MEDKKLTFNEKEVNETIDYCIKKQHEAFSIPVCKDGVEWALRGWRCAGGNRKQGYRAYKKTVCGRHFTKNKQENLLFNS